MRLLSIDTNEHMEAINENLNNGTFPSLIDSSLSLSLGVWTPKKYSFTFLLLGVIGRREKEKEKEKSRHVSETRHSQQNPLDVL